MKINLRLLRIYLAKIYPRYNLASIIKFLVHRVGLARWYCRSLMGQMIQVQCLVLATRGDSGEHCTQVKKRVQVIINPL